MQADFCLDREGSVKHIRQIQHSSDKKNLFQSLNALGENLLVPSLSQYLIPNGAIARY